VLGLQTGEEAHLVALRRTARRLAARRRTAARLAAALLEQTRVGLLLARHGVADHGRQDGDCRNNETIHLKSPPTCDRTQIQQSFGHDRRSFSFICPRRRLDGHVRLGSYALWSTRLEAAPKRGANIHEITWP
jgi:CRP-like cAMP-binding protein